MFRFSFTTALFTVLFSLLSCQAQMFDFSTSKVIIISNGDRESEIAADYFHYHLNKRNKDKNKFVVERLGDSELNKGINRIYFEIVPDLDCDYKIENSKDQLSVFSRDNHTMKWLSYMLINQFAVYHDIDVQDLPPSYLDFSSSNSNLAFRYRDPHVQPNMDQDMSALLYTNNVDRDWGIWGHNFAKVFSNHPDLNSLALVNGKRDQEQYCFSAPETYKAVKSYIIDNFGKDDRKDSLWFMIAPNDNDKVCLCHTCRKLGNSEKNATPAVANLMSKLAADFPMDHFYTIAYRTTLEAPAKQLGKNTGVLLSTIDFPKAANINVNDKSVIRFSSMFSNWKKKVDQVYIWDYISNFDDYLTPFPVLLRAQKQLSYFKKLGIEGVFMNGAGYDYSTFDDVKNYVLSALLINPDLSVPDLVDKYYKRFYPESGSLLSAYVLDLENQMISKNLDVNIYSSSKTALSSYIDVEKFNTFYESLLNIESKLQGEEKAKINKLLTSLSFTKLQMEYHLGTVKNKAFVLQDDKVQISSKVDFPLSLLNTYTDYDILKYKEEKGDIETYLQEWEKYKKHKQPVNLIQSVKIKGTQSSEGFENTHLLLDNKVGFESDFNQGWFLAADDIVIDCSVKNSIRSKANLHMNFLINQRHRMLPPDKVEILSNMKVIHTFTKDDFDFKEESVCLDQELNISNIDKLEIKIYKSKELKKSVIACDEILLY